MTEQTQPEQQPADAFKDKPRPFTIYRDEAAKTAEVQKDANTKRREVDEAYNKLAQQYGPAIASHTKELIAATAPRIDVRKEAVGKLTDEVSAIEQALADLQKKLEEERSRLYRSQDSLRAANKELKSETAKVEAEKAASQKAKVRELSAGIKAVKKTRREVYKTTGKALRREHWNTFKRTTKESVAFIPDLTMRFLKATKRAASEFKKAFGSSAQKAQAGFNEPTVFSIKRDKPVGPQVAKQAPKQ